MGKLHAIINRFLMSTKQAKAEDLTSFVSFLLLIKFIQENNYQLLGFSF